MKCLSSGTTTDHAEVLGCSAVKTAGGWRSRWLIVVVDAAERCAGAVDVKGDERAMGSRGKHAAGTRISDGTRRTIRSSAGDAQGMAPSPFRARLSARLRRPHGRGCRSCHRLQMARTSLIISCEALPSSSGRRLPLVSACCYIYALLIYHPLYCLRKPPSLSLSFAPLDPDAPSASVCAPYHSCTPRCATDHTTSRSGQLSLVCLTSGARLPYQVLHIRPSAQPPAPAIRTQLAYVSGRQ